MKVRYVGESFGVDGLTDGKVYECLGVELDGAAAALVDALTYGRVRGGLYGVTLRIVDDSGEDYLYSVSDPAPLDMSSPGGKWEVVEDDAEGTLARLLKGV